MVLFREREDGRDAYNDKRASLAGNTAFSLLNTNQWRNRSRAQKQRV
jgi:hypothetical protein